MTSLHECGLATYRSCERRGIHDPKVPSTAEVIAYIHAETSEVLDAWMSRNEHGLSWRGADGKPEGVGAELADVVLTCAYLAILLGVKLDQEIADKIAYNKTRPETAKRM